MTDTCQIRSVFEGAALGGHLDLCEWAVEKDPNAFGDEPLDDDDEWSYFRFWVEMVSATAGHGHLHVLRYIVESLHGGDDSAMHRAGLLDSALYGGHVEVLAYLVDECGVEVDEEDVEESLAFEGPFSSAGYKWLYERDLAPG